VSPFPCISGGILEGYARAMQFPGLPRAAPKSSKLKVEAQIADK